MDINIKALDAFDKPSLLGKLAVALDFDNDAEALRIVDLLKDEVGVYKVGLELFSASGPDVVSKIIDRGKNVFVDLKLHDIPNTVYKAARVLGSLGAKLITAHSAGGSDMLRAAAEGFIEGRTDAGLDENCYCLGVSMLTSDPSFSQNLFLNRLEAIIESGINGMVCSGTDLSIASDKAVDLFKVVPGIRPSGSPKGDQLRVTSPADAIKLGADLLVVGRPIIESSDPLATVQMILESISQAD